MATNPARPSAQIPSVALGPLVDALRERGYQVIGPTVRGDAAVSDEISSAKELPHG